MGVFIGNVHFVSVSDGCRRHDFHMSMYNKHFIIHNNPCAFVGGFFCEKRIHLFEIYSLIKQ